MASDKHNAVSDHVIGGCDRLLRIASIGSDPLNWRGSHPLEPLGPASCLREP